MTYPAFTDPARLARFAAAEAAPKAPAGGPSGALVDRETGTVISLVQGHSGDVDPDKVLIVGATAQPGQEIGQPELTLEERLMFLETLLAT